jgi:deoxyribodipyrimidine photo-lyase
MTELDLFLNVPAQSEMVSFEPTRGAGLERLEKFASRTGTHYATQRNYDYGVMNRSSVSALSPWIRHRLITEEEVLKQTLARHSPSAAMKFIQEMFWRGYFKGFLEQHPSVWTRYQSDLQIALDKLETDAARNLDYTDAIAGRTGIACFDYWCKELEKTGYLHNHARMWFASIWIFTLRLPWELGADFFLRHLIDGDPSSNTLSWRWVGGLHTKGKIYLARASNITKYTNGRFDPNGQLAANANPLVEDFEHALIPFSASKSQSPKTHLLLVTAEDCHPENSEMRAPAGVIGLTDTSSSEQSDRVTAFRKAAVEDAVERSGSTTVTYLPGTNWAETIIDAAASAGTKDVVTSWAPIGPTASNLTAVLPLLEQAGIRLHKVHRAYDRHTWPHATKGFFMLKKKIPTILRELELSTT